ncbi:sugar phosphate isomerase/epimerase family protein [Oceanibium sediminis]|uniref:sugar phosphate isomerase/epimerase family protein n=1 Tax=Oceanibium sediminis TaxID=2026339 RepID=UPI000DD4DEB0|nr:TIM barrel protein [Oceanibium sediminis]
MEMRVSPQPHKAGKSNLVMCAQCVGEVDFRTRVEAASAAGFSGIAYRTVDYLRDRSSGISDKAMLALLSDTAVDLSVVGLADGWGKDVRDLQDAETFRHMISLFRPPHVNATLMQAVDDFDETVVAFAQLCDFVREAGDAECLLEFLLFGGIRSLEDALRVVCGANAVNGGLVIDLWQLHQTGVTPADLARVPERLIKSVQICDVRPDPFESIREESRSGRVLAGDGVADIAGYLGALRAMGAAPLYEVEVLDDDLRSHGPMVAAHSMFDTSARALAASSVSPG